MSEGANADLMRRYWETGDRVGQGGDPEQWIAFLSEDVTWEALEDAPDAGTYRGVDGMQGYIRDWLETVDDIHFEVGEITELGDFVVTSQLMTATVKGTDAKMELRYSVAVRIADGKVVHGKEFREREEAIAYAQASHAS